MCVVCLFVVVLRQQQPLRYCPMEALSTLLAICEGNPMVTAGFKGPITRIFDISLSEFLTISRVDSDLRHHDAYLTSL